MNSCANWYSSNSTFDSRLAALKINPFSLIGAGLLLLGIVVGASGKPTNSNAGQETVESAISRLHSSSLQERRAAARYLAGQENERATEGLISALDNSDAQVRVTAVEALVDRVSNRELRERAVEGLIHALDSSAEVVRRDSVKGLTRVDSRRSTEGLIHALDSSDEILQQVAVDYLSRRARSSANDRATEGLIHALDNESFEIRRTAVLGLKDSSSSRARDGLRKALNDSDERIRQIAREALK